MLIYHSGSQAPIVMIGYFVSASALLKSFSPPFGKYTAAEQKLEGEFRFTHSRVITHAEEIAFYRGNKRELDIANSSFRNIYQQVQKIMSLQFFNGIFDSILVKYCATVIFQAIYPD
jgi:ATP-binding cassette subfamily D (ALD) protein 3